VREPVRFPRERTAELEMCRDNKVSRSADGAVSSAQQSPQSASSFGVTDGGQATRPNAWEWQCGMCTLINRPCNDMCEMCGFPRGTRSSGEADEQAKPKGPTTAVTTPSTCAASSPQSWQSPGQQILASLKPKHEADSPARRVLFLAPEAELSCDVQLEPARVDAGYEILAALRCGSAQVRTGGQELLATLKSGGAEKPRPDSSQQLLAFLKDGGDAAHSESVQPKRKAIRKRRRGGSGAGDRPMYSQVA